MNQQHYRKLRKRRQDKMRLRSKGKFSVGHKSKSGRTGSVFAKNLKSRSAHE